jgi:hypothetical protein
LVRVFLIGGDHLHGRALIVMEARLVVECCSDLSVERRELALRSEASLARCDGGPRLGCC